MSLPKIDSLSALSRLTLTISTDGRFQAFLLYLYTKSINFASFGSDENCRSRSHEIAWVSEEEIPKPSPKSIYRLADKVSEPSLRH